MAINTYTPESMMSYMRPVYDALVDIAKQALVAVLFAIGASLSIKVVREVGVKPLVQAVVLWVAIGVSSLIVCLYTIE